MTRKLSLKEHTSALKFLHNITAMNPVDCDKIINDPRSNTIIRLLSMLGKKDAEISEHEIETRVKQAAFELREIQKEEANS